MPFIRRLLAAGSCLALASAGCGGSDQSDALVGAAVTTAIAATTWAAAGGCRLQGCPWGSFCDEEKGLCEARSCSEQCPKGSYCNEHIDRCEDTPSVIQMNPSPYQPPGGTQPNDPNWQRPLLPSIPY